MRPDHVSQTLERARCIIDEEIEAMALLRDSFDDRLIAAVGLIQACAGRLIVTGVGKSGIVGRKIAATLSSTGTPAVFLHAGEAGHGDLGTIVRGDVVLAVSNSGENEEVVRLLPLARRFGLPLIAITGSPDSALGRAADVIQRMRDLLRKSEPEMSHLDLNALVRDVRRLLGSDTVIRDVTVVLDLDTGQAMVTGDRVQLEQVLLNLLLNAMEAMAEQPGAERMVVVRTRASDGNSVLTSVEDTGPGLRRGTQQMVFEPFYTTKRTGMGMGLAIARSIIEAHGGRIWAENNPSGGATFHFALASTTPEIV